MTGFGRSVSPSNSKLTVSKSPSHSKETVLSGIQPTGALHLGNYLGMVKNAVAMLEKYRCFYAIVDYHAMTVDHDPEELKRNTIEMAFDLIACGIDPQKCVFFVQSQVPEHTELTWILSAVTSYGD
ncbi:tryptophan--tRNA ligase, partial [Candidatus Acetothermia bacterium]|nr:tryptophan--tRNA ligase [Candidatus Acetothermia bacterium]